VTCPNTHFLLLSLSLSLCSLFTPRSSLSFALCAVSLPILTKVSRSLLAFHLALRHSHSGTSSSSSRFLAVAVRPCNATSTAVEPYLPLPRRHYRAPVPRCCCTVAAATATEAATAAVAATADAHYRVRQQGSCSAGSPRSTRTRHWPTTLDLASSLLFPRFSYALYTAIRLGPVSLSLPCPCSSSLPRCVSASLVVFSPPLPHPFSTCLGTSLSICLPFRLFSLIHLVPASLPVSLSFSSVFSLYFSAKM